MTDKPIIFSGQMVRALLEGRKTQTRRILKPQHVLDAVSSEQLEDLEFRGWDGFRHDGIMGAARYPYAPGDRLWVREAFATDGLGGVRYAATDDIHELRKKTSPIHMPRWASRLTLIVESVKVERLQDISEEDAIAEGVESTDGYWVRANAHLGHEDGDWIPNYPPAAAFANLWNSIHGPGSWDANPWVAAITFRTIKANIDSPEAIHDR